MEDAKRHIFQQCATAFLACLVLAATHPAHAVSNFAPIGAFDRCAADYFHCSGWAYDPDTLKPIDVHIYLDGQLAWIWKAGSRRDDLIAANVAPNAEHGFVFDLLGVRPGTHRIDVYAINVDTTGAVVGSGNVWLGQKTVSITNSVPNGYLYGADATSVRGWAWDPDAGVNPIVVHIYVDKQVRDAVWADQFSPDLVGPTPDGYHAFAYSLSGLAPGTHRIDAYAIDSTGGFNPILGFSPQFITVPGSATDRGWNPGLTHPRIANYYPTDRTATWAPYNAPTYVNEAATYFEDCPWDGGCYRGGAGIPPGGGFYTLANEMNPPPQVCKVNSWQLFWHPYTGTQTCPFGFFWGSEPGKIFANLRLNTLPWTISSTPAIYHGLQENISVVVPGDPDPEYFGNGGNVATIDRARFTVTLAGSYRMGTPSSKHRMLVGVHWNVGSQAYVLEINLNAVTHEHVPAWSTTARVVENTACGQNPRCLYLGGEYWGFPSVLGQRTTITINWARIAMALTSATCPTGGGPDCLPTTAVGPHPLAAVYLGVETLGKVDASLEVSDFRQADGN